MREAEEVEGFRLPLSQLLKLLGDQPVQTTFDAIRKQVAPDAPGALGSIAGKEACLDLLAHGFVTPVIWALGDRFSQA